MAAAGTSSAQLSTGFYSSSCPGVYDAVKSVVQSAVASEQRMGASIVRLFFHDCFVQVRTLLRVWWCGSIDHVGMHACCCAA
jgi:hypothetical protein